MGASDRVSEWETYRVYVVTLTIEYNVTHFCKMERTQSLIKISVVLVFVEGDR